MAEMTVDRRRTEGIDVGAAVWAGVVAGIVFMVMEMIMMPAFGGAPSMWAPPRMIAAIALGEGVLPPPATFDAGAVTVAMVIHFALSIAFGIVTAFIVRRMSVAGAAAVGIVLALLLYAFVFYAMTPVWPWFAMARGWISIVAHVAFGAIVGWWYASRAKRPLSATSG